MLAAERTCWKEILREMVDVGVGTSKKEMREWTEKYFGAKGEYVKIAVSGYTGTGRGGGGGASASWGGHALRLSIIQMYIA